MAQAKIAEKPNTRESGKNSSGELVQSRWLALINAVGSAASRSLDLSEILQTAVDQIVRLMRLEVVSIRLVENGVVVLKTHLGLSPQFLAGETNVPLGECCCGKSAQSGEVLFISELETIKAPSLPACAREGFRSVISIPMQSEGRVLGVLHAASRQPAAFSQTEVQVLTAIANRIAVAVDNARLYEEAKQRARHMELASLIGQRMTALIDVDTLLDEVARLICERYHLYRTSILLVDQNTNELVLKVVRGPDAEPVKTNGVRLKIGQEGIAGRVAETGQTWLCNDVRREPRCEVREMLGKETRAELAMPLKIGTRVLGVLDVQSDHCGAFQKEDVTVLHILANQLGVAVENARLFQETKSRYDAMVALHETSLDIISQLDRRELLDSLLRRGVHLVGASSGLLSLYDPAQNAAYHVANYGTAHNWKGHVMRPGEGVVGQVILTGQPLIVDDYYAWEGKAELSVYEPFTRIMAVPLTWQEQIVGVIAVLKESTARSFNEQDLWLLGQFADLATIAIKNADLHAEVKGFGQRLEKEVEARTHELCRAQEEVAAKAGQLRSLLAKTIRIQEEERARIARDMHDGVVQLVTAVRIELQAVRAISGSEPPPALEEKLGAAREMLDEMEQEIRHAIHNLHPPVLDAVGLVPALRRYAASVEALSSLKCRVQTNGTPRRLPPSIEGGVFRIVEEALNNVATHAGAGAALVVVDFQPAVLYVTIEDNGHGFDYTKWTRSRNGEHLGLASMRERTESLGGKMHVWSRPGQGTRLIIWLPIPEDQADVVSQN